MTKKHSEEKKQFPAQHQEHQPGRETLMHPKPVYEDESKTASSRLSGKVAVITGGDSGIGRAVAVAFAREGADLALLYLEETNDAKETQKAVKGHGRRCITIAGDIGDSDFCHAAVRRVVDELGHIDVLVNNAAEQHPTENILEISPEQVERTFRTNIFSFFYMTQASLPHMREGSAIVNTSSVTAYRGSPHLLDYSSTKGAIIAFTRSLALNLAKQGIRVNAVAPGPIWTPLIPSTFPPEEVETFGSDTPLGRAGQPVEVAPAYVFLASDDSSYMTGQVLHPNGGEIING